MNNIVENSIEKVADTIDDIVTMKKQDVREFTGVLDPKGKTPQEKITGD